MLAMLCGATVFAGRLLVNRWENALGEGVLVAPEAREPELPRHTSVKGPLTYLLIGTDRRVDVPAAGSRADAIIIAHIFADLRQAYLISIPRDLLVPIPGHGDNKINAAYQLGGADDRGTRLLSAALNQLTNIAFDGAAVLDFGGFAKVVDAIGGVELCLDEPIGAAFPAGCQRLTGARALDLARERQYLAGGDFDRMRNQQLLILAMVHRAATIDMLTDVIRLDRTIQAAGDALTVDTGGAPLSALAFALRHLRADLITGITLPSYPQTIDGISYVLAGSAARGLYEAVRDSTLAAWVSENPHWRNG